MKYLNTYDLRYDERYRILKKEVIMDEKRRNALMKAFVELMMRQTFDLKDLKNMDSSILAQANKLIEEPEIAILEVTKSELIDFLYSLIADILKEAQAILKEQQAGDL